MTKPSTHTRKELAHRSSAGVDVTLQAPSRARGFSPAGASSSRRAEQPWRRVTCCRAWSFCLLT
jgi:hypothetical protein